jgi:hypothetical protein
MHLTDPVTDDAKGPPTKKMQASVEEAKKKSEQERRRNLEVRSSFFDKLSALNAGSVAVTASVGIALLSRPDSRFGSLHSHLSWLLLIASFLWVSLICSVGHNSILVKIAQLESVQAEKWSDYLELLNVLFAGSSEVTEVLTKHFADTFHKRINDAALNAHKTEQSVRRAFLLGNIATATFLIAYTLVVVAVVHIWWITRLDHNTWRP